MKTIDVNSWKFMDFFPYSQQMMMTVNDWDGETVGW